MFLGEKIKLHLYSFLLRILLGSVFFTCRWKVIGLSNFDIAIKKNKPIMLCFWHKDLIYIARYFKKTPLNLYGVSSTHLDSEIMAKLLTAWNIGLIRGSSTRGWSNVLKKIISLSKDVTSIVALSNDGPQGPPLIAKEGSLSAAKKYDYQVVVVSSSAVRQWRLPSWDKTCIPKPFSSINIKFSLPYPKNDDINVKNITEFINNNQVVL